MGDSQGPARELALIAGALGSLSLPPPNLEELEAELLCHHTTMPLMRLGLDSLGRMEFCIHLELDHGVVITPETLLTIDTVEELIQLIRASQL